MAGAKRIDFLDHLRGVAILSVFADHAVGGAFSFRPVPYQWHGWVRDFHLDWQALLLLPMTMGGTIGVGIFFVISGFCIHLSHERSSTPGLRAFFTRRFFRIYPPYLLVLIFFALVFPWTSLFRGGAHPGWFGQFFSHLLLVHNWSTTTVYGVAGRFWSIAVEAQLYVLYPLVQHVAARAGWPPVLWGTAIIEISLRSLNAAFTQGLAVLLYLPFTYWFSWCIGAAVADAFLRGGDLPLARFTVLPWAVLAGGAFLVKPLVNFCFPLVAIATAIVISRLIHRPDAEQSHARTEGPWLRQLRFAGVVSYSAYLIHSPLLDRCPGLVHALLPGWHPGVILLFLIALASWFIIGGLSYCSYRTVELPSIQLGKVLLNRGVNLPRRAESARQSS